MAHKLISIACEGSHDVAFLNRLLKAQGFRTNEKIKIGEYPSPMGRFFETSLRRSDFQQLNFSEARQVPLPSHALNKEDVFIFLYSLGGDSKRAERAALLKRMAAFIPSDEQEIRVLPDGTSLTMVFMFDADNVGVGPRLESMRQELAEAVGVDPAEIAVRANGDCCQVKGLGVGCLVLTDESNETGKLEDVLLPLMRQGNELIFEAADQFIDGYYDATRTRFLRIRPTETGVEESRGSDKDFDRKKSLIGVVAQLQISGKPNQACINRTDYLNLEKLSNSPHCIPIRAFLERVISS